MYSRIPSRTRRLAALGLPAVFFLMACEQTTSPEMSLGDEDLINTPLAETMDGEVDASVDSELTDAMIEDLRFAMSTESISATASSKRAARLASTVALIAPADVPEMTEKGLEAPEGSSLAIAFRTPT